MEICDCFFVCLFISVLSLLNQLLLSGGCRGRDHTCKCVKFLHLFLLIFDFSYFNAIFVVNFSLMSVCAASTCSHQSFDGASYYVVGFTITCIISAYYH